MTDLVRSFRKDFDELVAAHGDRPAIIADHAVDPVTLDFRDLSRFVKRSQALFESRGLKPGDTILALMPNAAETLILCLAAIRGGYGFAPLPCTASARETAKWISLVRPGMIVCTNLIGDEARAALDASGLDPLIVEADTRFKWLPQADPSQEGDDPRLYLATSGTTGDPEAIVLDGNRLWSAGRAFMHFHDLAESRLRFWNYLPMSYLGGLFNLGLIPLCVGGSTVIGEAFSGKTVLGFWQTIQRFEINAVWLVPTMVRGLLAMAERTRRSGERPLPGAGIQVAFLGTAPIELETKERFERAVGFRMLENFALSETTFFSSETPDDLEHRTESSTGRILPYADVKLVPLELEDAPATGSGSEPQEIYVRSPFLFLGYLRGDGTLENPLDAEGYLPTGDLGHLDSTGQLVIDGRKRDIIKKGGYFVPLREIEVLAQQHDAVVESAAVRVPHDFYGESYVLCIVLDRAHEGASEQEVGRFLRENLVQYKWPERIVALDELPRTSSGKIRKHLLSRSIAETR
jgi:acyl-CoA synthetase (AMP-forming)/AMP-acid ligase II